MEGNETQATNTPSEGTPVEGNNQQTPQSYELSGWTAGLPAEQKERYGAELSKYQKIGDFAQSAFEAQDKLSRAIIRPGEEATAEEITAYRESMGLPVDSNSYELNAEGTGTEQFLDGLKEVAFNNDLSQAQAQGMTNYFMEMEKKAQAMLETERNNFIEAGLKDLHESLGSSFDAKTTIAKRTVRTHFGDEFTDYLEDSQLGNDPRFIKGMIAMSELISEDDLDNPSHVEKKSGGYSFPNTPGME